MTTLTKFITLLIDKDNSMIQLLFGGALLVAMVLMIWESEKMIQEKKRGRK